MNKSIIAHTLSGVTIQQRNKDGYLNATRLAKAYEAETGTRKDVRDWLLTERSKSYLKHLSAKTGLTVLELVQVKKGGNAPGTWVHPKLATPFATWLSVEYEFQVSEWIEQWMTTGQNPVKSNTKTSAQRDLERFEERIRLKDEARLALSDVVKEWMEYHGWYHDRKRVSKYFIALMDGINVAITTETSLQMQKRLAAHLGRKPKSGELIRDYFRVEELRLYLSVHNVLTNLLLMAPIGERNGLKYLNQAIALALPRKFKATPISFETQSYLQGSQTELVLA